MKKIILYSLSFFLILNTLAYSKEKPNEDFYGQFYTQKPQQLDCQSITLDEEYLKNDQVKTKSFEKLICFYKVKVAEQELTMGKEVGSSNYGFVK